MSARWLTHWTGCAAGTLGNYPQAFPHVGLITAAWRLAHANDGATPGIRTQHPGRGHADGGTRRVSPTEPGSRHRFVRDDLPKTAADPAGGQRGAAGRRAPRHRQPATAVHAGAPARRSPGPRRPKSVPWRFARPPHGRRPGLPWLADGRVAALGPQIPFSTPAWLVLRSILGFLALVLNLAGVLLSLALGFLRLVLCLLDRTHDGLLFIA